LTKESSLNLLLAIHADFCGQTIALSRELSDLIEIGLVNLAAMSRDERREAIEQPALRTGLRFEDGLVERLLDQLGGTGREPPPIPSGIGKVSLGFFSL